jgi:mRNA interferase RelE/StbE
MENYQIQLIPLALKLLGKIKDQREQKILTKRIEQLKQEPEKQGKALSGKLRGYRSIRAVGQRYRIIYRIDQENIVVIIIIIGVGIRKDGDKEDIYNYLQKIFDPLE